MKKSIFSICLCIIALAATTGCIDQRYDMSKLSTKIALGGDSLSLPLVSQGKIMVGEALETFLKDSIKGLEHDSVSGAYTFEMGDSFSYVLDSAAKEEMGLNKIGIEDQVFEESFEVEGLDASAINISIKGLSEKASIDLNMSDIALENIALPHVAIDQHFQNDLSKYQLSEDQRHIDIDAVHIEKSNLLGEAALPAELEIFANNLPHTEIPLILPSNTLDISIQEEMSMQMELPEGLKNIGDVQLQKTPKAATLSIRLQLENADQFLTAGDILPHISILPTDIFIFDNNADIVNGKIVFDSQDIMNKDNQYTINKSFKISALNIGGTPENKLLSFQKNISAEGNVQVQNIKYYADEITQIKNLKLKMDVAFNDMVVESLSFEIEGQSSQIQGESELALSTELPEQIAGIQQIIAEHGSTINIHIQGNEELKALKNNLMLESFSLQFPQALKFKAQEGLDLTNNRFSLPQQTFNPAQGLQLSFTLESVDMSQIPVNNGQLAWNDKIRYDAQVKLQGNINSAMLPNKADFSIKASSKLTIKDIIAQTNKIDYALNQMSFTFEESIESPVDELSAIKSAKLENAFIDINLKLPKLPLPLKANNICISLPKMMEFASHPLLNSNNELTINGDIPENIHLELKKLNINKAFENGVMNINESVNLSGGICVEAGQTSAQALADALKEKVEVVFSLSDMKLTDIGASIKGISYQMCDTIAFKENIEIPKEIKRIDSIILKEGAQINLALLAENLPELEQPIIMTFSVQLPDIFLLESPEIKEGNIWTFRSEVRNNKAIEKTILVKGLDLSSLDLSSERLQLNEQIVYDAHIFLDACDVNSSDLSDKPIKLSTKAAIKGLNLNKVYGIIDPNIEAISESISLEDLPDVLKDSTMVSLEINPSIALSAKSNITMPLVIDAQLTPIMQGLANESRQQKIHIELPRAANANEVKEHHFWIAANSAEMPNGYEFIKLDVNDILKSIPDQLKFEVKVNTDQEVQHEIDLGADYSADLNYHISIPIAFGEHSHFSMKDTLDLDLSDLEGYLDYIGENIEIFGEIENSLPLNLTASLLALDEEMNIIDMEPIQLQVKAGNNDGSANISPVSIKLDNKNHQFDHLKAFELDFRLSADADAANTPISDDNYLQVKLKLRVNGGIVLDVNEL